jgi:regulator of protease activity HflC (stomatin/prohibitin superfamily)
MFGIRFIKAEPTHFIMLFRKGKIRREGVGLSFFYFAPTTSLVLVPVASADVPFIFEEVTSDFQAVTVQGQITYRVADPKKLAQLMNFTLSRNLNEYTSDDPGKLPQRLINHTQVLTRALLKSLPLRKALGESDSLELSLREGLQKAEIVTSLGVELLGLSILAIKPTPETARALEAEAREQILGEADQAVFVRRNAAVEQERAIKENELNTEIAVENKKREINEAQIAAKIAVEERNKELVALSAANARKEAETKAYAISVVMKSLAETDPKTLQTLASVNMEPGQLVAFAFKELAENADKIGQLNISPELLRELLSRDAPK